MGDPEPWEEVFFRDQQLESCRQSAADDPSQPRWQRELEALEARQLVVGNLFPIADSDLVQFVAKSLGTQLLR